MPGEVSISRDIPVKRSAGSMTIYHSPAIQVDVAAGATDPGVIWAARAGPSSAN